MKPLDFKALAALIEKVADEQAAARGCYVARVDGMAVLRCDDRDGFRVRIAKRDGVRGFLSCGVAFDISVPVSVAGADLIAYEAGHAAELVQSLSEIPPSIPDLSLGVTCPIHRPKWDDQGNLKRIHYVTSLDRERWSFTCDAPSWIDGRACRHSHHALPSPVALVGDRGYAIEYRA